jgi:hypothetical protein
MGQRRPIGDGPGIPSERPRPAREAWIAATKAGAWQRRGSRQPDDDSEHQRRGSGSQTGIRDSMAGSGSRRLGRDQWPRPDPDVGAVRRGAAPRMRRSRGRGASQAPAQSPTSREAGPLTVGRSAALPGHLRPRPHEGGRAPGGSAATSPAGGPLDPEAGSAMPEASKPTDNNEKGPAEAEP